MAYDFEGKKALVTGGSRGIGKAIVKGLITSGAKVFALARSRENLEKLKSEIPEVYIVVVDLADWESTKVAVESLGDLDFLVNNAASLDDPKIHSSFIEVPKPTLDKSIDVNLKAAFNISQIVARNFIKRECGGAIINMSSTAGIRAFKNVSVYDITKAGLDMMTKVMALELGPHNIRVNTVSPTRVITEKHLEQQKDPAMEEKLKSFTERHPLGKFAELEDVVNTTLFLLSDKASMITGINLPVDGGFLVS